MEHQKEEEQILTQLQDVQEKQHKNDRALQKNEETTQHVHHLRQKSQQLFNDLHDAWRDDQSFAHIIQQNKLDVQHQEQQLSTQLEIKRTKLKQEKQTLFQVESNLYKQHRVLRQEEPR